MRTSLLVAVLAALAVGALTAVGEIHLDGTPEAFASSISVWLVTPFVVGTFARTRREAAVAGFVT